MSFPNLKELHLYKVEMLDGDGNYKDKLIDLDDLYLEKLSLITGKRLDSAKIPERESLYAQKYRRGVNIPNYVLMRF